MKWWEKTVEYFFIQKYVPREMILSPLDGKQELAGDALLSDSQNWVIIEFKKDFESLGSEERKYKDYSKAKDELKDEDSHHFLVYGQVRDKEFTLGGSQYFSREPVNSIDVIFSSGKPKDEFLSYLEKLIRHKSLGGESSGGTIGSYSFVAGISKNNKVTSCMNLYEFGLDHGLDLEPKPQIVQEISRGYSGPSR